MVFFALLSSYLSSKAIEERIVQIKIGMNKSEVELLLGNGKKDISWPTCKKCPEKREQIWYKGNPSLWYGHFEDALIVCYANNAVCDFERYGL